MTNGASDPVITWRHKPDPLPLARALGYWPVAIPEKWRELTAKPGAVHRCHIKRTDADDD